MSSYTEDGIILNKQFLMTGRGHRFTGVGAAFIAATIAQLAGFGVIWQIAAGIIAASSTTMPDWIEIPFYRNGMRTGSLIAHRTLTHWPFLWVLVLWYGLTLGDLPGAVLIGAAVGSIVHILGDSPNPMGIPWVLPYRRIRLGRKGWWRSGEYEIPLIIFFFLLGFIPWFHLNQDSPLVRVGWLKIKTFACTSLTLECNYNIL